MYKQIKEAQRQRRKREKQPLPYTVSKRILPSTNWHLADQSDFERKQKEPE